MLKNKLSIIFITILLIISIIFFIPNENVFKITEVYSPIKFKINNEIFILNNLTTFDSSFTESNSKLSKELNITETEAFILGNLAKEWAYKLMKGRKISINKNDLIFNKYSYKNKFLYSGFCIINSKPYANEKFKQILEEVRHTKYKVLDMNTEILYELNDNHIKNLENIILIKKSNYNKYFKKTPIYYDFDNGEIKILYTDLTQKIKPDRNCSTNICKEIVDNINNAKNSIDIAIYGYSSVPAIENALKNAIKRNVQIRLIYDLDDKGKNIYPDTSKLLSLLKNNNNDGNSLEAKNIMHNKFYIFDNKILITGSANLSHTDMSGFNSNSIAIIKSEKIAKIYKTEFEQMFKGKFHNEKYSFNNKKISLSGTNIDVYFSPQDKSITKAILPLIKNAKEYIYIPTFVLTEKRVTEELIKAKNRGVDVKIIIDALNASIRHSKHQELRTGGILVKTENWAGKMHSKSMIIDDKYTIIGSMNFSYSGENKNDENFIVIENTNITKEYKNFFLKQWNKIDNKWLYTNARAESKESIGSCYDGLDNNYNGLTDSEDPACK